MRLLPARDESLLEQAPHRFASVQPQKSRTLGETEQVAGPGGTQPLELHRQLRVIKVFARRRGGSGVRSATRRVSRERRKTVAGDGAQPSVFSPHHLLNRGLPSQRASSP